MRGDTVPHHELLEGGRTAVMYGESDDYQTSKTMPTDNILGHTGHLAPSTPSLEHLDPDSRCPCSQALHWVNIGPLSCEGRVTRNAGERALHPAVGSALLSSVTCW